ncbi:MAG TPA: carbon-nitrogen family hydrolase [bacterium]|nr:carbon-nitrogen family hydrolase [bacterium]
MKIIGVQLDIVWENKQANFAKVGSLLEEVPIDPGSLIVLPEMFATGFSMNVAAMAEDESGGTFAFLKDLARRRQAFVGGGVVTRNPDGRGCNEAVIIDSRGFLYSRYSKIHPFSLAGENRHYAPGNRIVTFPLHEFTVAPFICYDLRFPEIFRLAVRRNVDLFMVIACWPAKRESHWMALLAARAIENQAYVIGVNRCGADPEHAYSGRSQIVDPSGRVIADAGNDEGLLRAELDHAWVENYRRELPFLTDRREEYHLD